VKPSLTILAALLLAGTAGATGTTLQTQRGISTGAYHACAVTSAGAVSCWGWNQEGALGNGTTKNSNQPVPVFGLSSGVVMVSSNYNHSCALLVSGSVKCWGRNGEGQLGDGTKNLRTKPVLVKGLPSTLVSIAVGKEHSCSTTDAGIVYCWGRFSRTSRSLTAVQIPGLTDVASLAVGKGFSCALTTLGAVKCWGKNDLGQLGDGTGADSAVPVAVTGLSSGVISISASGDFACALTSSSEAKCWAENDHGQLGDGTTVQSLVPVAVQDPGTDLVAITVGANNACTLSTSNVVRCWGRNDHGQLGDGSTVESHVPVTVASLGTGVTSISAGASGHFVCALTSAGVVKCWGRNDYGQLGDGTKTDRLLPTTVMTLP
jgi:alpha-tubulin suppressor-like RCC1 family protein